ncbi:hypothetical protein OUZ56_026488 [Daphnia magna]|uniref:Uncharacterized protein n=1 Tax=Daphnia magna TaxID=35525 RepID=A0ABQ9ZLW4_9CRUS|nr:hypothetical protein OUZ56_026488 [Daphnia magna]
MVRCKPLGRRNDGDRECCGSSSNFGEREIKGTQGTCAGHAAAGQDAPIAGEGIQQIETECECGYECVSFAGERLHSSPRRLHFDCRSVTESVKQSLQAQLTTAGAKPLPWWPQLLQQIGLQLWRERHTAGDGLPMRSILRDRGTQHRKLSDESC